MSDMNTRLAVMVDAIKPPECDICDKRDDATDYSASHTITATLWFGWWGKSITINACELHVKEAREVVERFAL